MSTTVSQRAQSGQEPERVAYDPVVSVERAELFNVELVGLTELLERADFVTVHVPLVEANRNLIGAAELSLAAVAQRFAGVTLPKGATLTDWSRRPLPDSALEYALDDVRHLPELWRVLTGLLQERGREAWVEDEAGRVLERSLEPPDPATAWRRLDNARRLRGLSLAVAVETAAWRLGKAMELNRPVKRVMGDLAIMAIAESRPTTLETLSTQRGVDRGIVRDFGDEIVAAVGRALALSPSEWPRRPAPPPPELAAVHDALGLAARLTSHEAEIASWLAYERDDLAALAEDPPRGRMTEGWRAEVLAPPLLRLLRGETVLTVSGRRLRLVPPSG